METAVLTEGGETPVRSRIGAAAEAALLAQRGYLLPWAPVALGVGIGLYFALPAEPGPSAWAGVGLGGVLAFLASRAVPLGFAPLMLALVLGAAGLGLSGARAWWVAAPVLDFRYYGPIEGRIVGIDRSASDAVRLTLDRVVLEDMPPDRTPPGSGSPLGETSAGCRPSRDAW